MLQKGKSFKMRGKRIGPRTYDGAARPRVVQNRHNRDVFISWLRRVWHSSVSNATERQGGKEGGHTRAREVRRHADEFQAGRTRAEFVELQSVLLCDAGLPGLGRRGTDSRDVRSRKRLTIGGDAGEGGGTDAEEGEEEESLVLCAVMIAARVMLLDPSHEAK
jgi:hypothetical protein